MRDVSNQTPPDVAGLTALERAAGYGHESINALSIKFKVSPAEVKAALDSYLRKTRHPVKDRPKEKKKRAARVHGSYQRWNDSEVARLREMVQKGLDWEEIAKTMGRSAASVRDKAGKVFGTSKCRRITNR